MTKRRGRTRESPHVLVFRVFYEAARNLDSRPPLRTDHVEACRPQGYVQTIVSAGTRVPNSAPAQARDQMFAQRSHVSSGTRPRRMSTANTWQPRQSAKTDSSVAATTSRPTRTSAAPVSPNPSASTAADVVNAAPMPCAKRFGGPATYFGAPSRGAITPLASRPSGLSVGPVSTRAQKPYASGTSSQCAPVSNTTTPARATTPATTRAAFSLRGFGKENIASETVATCQ